MNYIYTNTRDNRKYVLDPQTTMGSKVCLVDMANGEDKFVSLNTLKRWYRKGTTEDILVTVKAFTGMFIGIYPAYCNDTEIVIWTKNNKCLTFDSETYTQTNAKNPKFANKLGIEYNYMEATLQWVLS